jgi:hypothetical protein
MRNAKAIVAAILAVATAVNTAIADNVFGLDEAPGIVSVVVTAAIGVWLVWRVPNAPDQDRRG